QFYSHQSVLLRSLEDIEGLRIAVLEGAVQEAELLALTDAAGITFNLVPVNSLYDGFQAVSQRRADAVVTNNYFVGRFQFNSDLVETPVTFGHVGLFFATA